MAASDAIIAKIHGCLALGKSSNENEAATALAMAQKLMQQYNITADQINETGIEGIVEGVTQLGYKRDQQWVTNLAVSIGKAFFCRTLIRGGEYVFIGRKTNVEACLYSFHNLAWKLIDLGQKKTHEYAQEFKEKHNVSAKLIGGVHHPTFWRNSWILGAASALRKKLEAGSKTFEEQEASAKALVVQRFAEADEFIRKNIPNLGRKEYSEKAIRNDAWGQGFEDGKQIEVSKGLESRPNALLKE